MKRLTDVQFWEENWWKRERPQRLWLYRDFDFETVRLLRDAAKNLKPAARRERLRVLEVGAGGSRVLPYLGRKFGWRVFGSDFSPGGCQLLRANLTLKKIEGGVVCEDLFLSSLPASQFEIVYSSGLIEHFDDTRAVVAEHLKLVRPGGRLVIIVPNLQGIHGRIMKRLGFPLWQRHRVFSPSDLAGYMKDVGAGEVRSGYLGSFLIAVGRGEGWPPIARLPAALGALVHYSVRLGNGLISFFFRVLPFRPHSKTFSPAFFATGVKPGK
jgi:SAM-dependent methyltransferase